VDGDSPLERRLALAHLPTPLEPADRLGAALGLAPGALWVKRDDQTGLGGGGNKARKLEYLCADALEQGCDTLVTGGGRQSNHVRMTAAAANKLGLECTIVIGGGRPDRPSGNLLLDELMGAEIVWAGDWAYYAVEAEITATCDRLREAGRNPYAMPIGGASAVGALGYVLGGQELMAQDPNIDVVVTADGSGGTHAGLAVAFGDHAKVLGVDVGARPDLDEQVPMKAKEVAALAGLPAPVGECHVDHDHFGPDYGAPTDESRDALKLAARLEGLILDPVYTGKALAAFVTACRAERIDPAARIVFLHTGGMPALFASTFATWFRDD
jgi:D-cysteine desulfhydrase family pyridoxal phosphate-dependent enzyme